ncbi:uncharacterized protein FTOL_08406 [Fusarium torulosum]|uniref:Uncharacterized protein n=1 Tax=Fusarium torulosum TaxID=33205 RepID=A0AAE8ME62_9HYPO|nr:uncharacterized protein FTOL_08406 [Fusarium torulosum]
MTDRRASPSRLQWLTAWVPSTASTDLVSKFQRFHPKPAIIHKLSHYGFIVTKWDEELKWYTSNFNFVPSDVLSSPSNKYTDVIAFIHLDLGGEFSNHHSLFLCRAAPGEIPAGSSSVWGTEMPAEMTEDGVKATAA